jgi:hypothetical protein
MSLQDAILNNLRRMDAHGDEHLSPNPDATELPPYRFVREIDARVDSVFAAIRDTPYWAELSSANTPPERVQLLVREMLLSIHWYQAHTSEAEHRMIARLPKKKLRNSKQLILRESAGKEHGGWALGDYLALGGDHKTAKLLPPDPSTFAVAAVWWHLVEVEDPWAGLGADYFFENIIARIAQSIIAILKRRKMEVAKLHFLSTHAQPNAPHRYPIRELIVEASTRFPDTQKSILRGVEYLEHVFPLPLWDAAYVRVGQDWKRNYHDRWAEYVESLNDSAAVRSKFEVPTL